MIKTFASKATAALFAGLPVRQFGADVQRMAQRKLAMLMTAAGLNLPVRHPVRWVVDCKHVGAGEKALVYLGRYLYRGVLQEKDILACEDGQVSFRYQDAKTQRRQTRTLPGADFLWLLLQHVLPKSFRRARNFGFLHHNSKRLRELLRRLLKFAPGRAGAWVGLNAVELSSGPV